MSNLAKNSLNLADFSGGGITQQHDDRRKCFNLSLTVASLSHRVFVYNTLTVMHQSRTVCLRQLRLFENFTPIVNKLLQYSAFGSQKPHRCFPFARPRQVWTYSSIILPQSVSFRCGIRAPPGSLRPRVHIPKRFLDRFIRFGTAHARNQ